jgi:hypothetical protein
MAQIANLQLTWLFQSTIFPKSNNQPVMFPFGIGLYVIRLFKNECCFRKHFQVEQSLKLL